MLVIKWFESNYMKLNEDKCNFLLPGYKHEKMFVKIGQIRIWESEKQNCWVLPSTNLLSLKSIL